jgi:hypothetical protein
MARAAQRRKYQKKANRPVIAVRLDLDTKGIAYRKWGAKQHAQRGDWLVDNGGDVYTVNGRVFARTYKRLSPGVYVKTAPVWAEIAAKAGSIKTKEGASHYRRGDYLVFNDRNGRDGYCVSAAKFKAMYRRAR